MNIKEHQLSTESNFSEFFTPANLDLTSNCLTKNQLTNNRGKISTAFNLTVDTITHTHICAICDRPFPGKKI